MTKGKRKEALVRASIPSDVLYARLLTSVVTRSEFILGTATANAWRGAIRARKWSSVIELADDLDNTEYVGILDQYVKSQLVALVKKYPFTVDEVPGFNPELAAWKKFQLAEHRCKRINQRQSVLRNGVGFSYGQILSDAREYIKMVLGTKPNLRKIYQECDFGPGASVGVSGDLTNLGRKLLADKWSCTRLALSYCTEALWQHTQIRDYILFEEGRQFVCYDREKFSKIVASRVRLVTHNNISFVPKTFKIKRSIASEPLLNGFIQKGIDREMRELLARVGLDLTDQFRNSELARIGSIGGFDPFCTIDLSSASDSLSESIVRLLLPPAWFELLNSTRSHCYRYRGEVYPYHKFVSMGNGFCFPLQTLIFAAICHACSKHVGHSDDFRVYGDDIIVRRSVAALVLEVLRYIGFRNNPDKTFIFGPFRESCGTDWYSGQDIRPVYLDFRLELNSDLYKFHNSTLRSAFTAGLFSDVRVMLRDACPSEVRFVRPYHGNADSAFTVEHDVALSSPHVVWDRSRWALSWKEVQFTSVRDKLATYDPHLCNMLEYIAVLRGSSSRVPLAVRRKTRAQIRRKSYWALPGEMTWAGADPIRGETP